MNITLIKIAIIYLLNIYDCIVTYFGVIVRGNTELNFLMRELIHKEFPAAVLLKLLILSLCLFLIYRNKEDNSAQLSMNFIIIVYFLTMILNTISLFQ